MELSLASLSNQGKPVVRTKAAAVYSPLVDMEGGSRGVGEEQGTQRGSDAAGVEIGGRRCVPLPPGCVPLREGLCPFEYPGIPDVFPRIFKGA